MGPKQDDPSLVRVGCVLADRPAVDSRDVKRPKFQRQRVSDRKTGSAKKRSHPFALSYRVDDVDDEALDSRPNVAQFLPNSERVKIPKMPSAAVMK